MDKQELEGREIVKLMSPTEYVQAVLTMENQNIDGIRERLLDVRTVRLLHALLGINTENGELQDQFKKYLIYGKPLDRTNVIEELGDLLWYVALASDVMQIGFGEIMEANIAKLRKRYPSGYSHANALNRDIPAERKILDDRSGNPGPGPVQAILESGVNKPVPAPSPSGVRVEDSSD